MGIERNYERSVDIYRLTAEESGYGEEYALHLADVSCSIQAQDERYSEDVDGNFGKDFFMVCGNVDVKEGDRVIDGTDTYRVVGVEVYSKGGNPHTELVIRISNV